MSTAQKKSIVQTAYTSGEVSPSTYGRRGSEALASGVARLRNFFINEQGSISNRSGFAYVTRAIRPGPIKLEGFVYKKNQVYTVEFADRTVAFLKNKERIYLRDSTPIVDMQYFAAEDVVVMRLVNAEELSAGDVIRLDGVDSAGIDGLEFRVLNIYEYEAGGPFDGEPGVVVDVPKDMLTDPGASGSYWKAYTIASPYDIESVPLINVAQNGEEMTVACYGFGLHVLKRVSDDDWEFTNSDVEDQDLPPSVTGLVPFNTHWAYSPPVQRPVPIVPPFRAGDDCIRIAVSVIVTKNAVDKESYASITFVEEPKIDAAQYVDVKWGKVENAKEYRVYAGVSDSAYSQNVTDHGFDRIAVVTGATSYRINYNYSRTGTEHPVFRDITSPGTIGAPVAIEYVQFNAWKTQADSDVSAKPWIPGIATAPNAGSNYRNFYFSTPQKRGYTVIKTVTPHGLNTGDIVEVIGHEVLGETSKSPINGKFYIVVRLDDSKVRIDGEDTTIYNMGRFVDGNGSLQRIIDPAGSAFNSAAPTAVTFYQNRRVTVGPPDALSTFTLSKIGAFGVINPTSGGGDVLANDGIKGGIDHWENTEIVGVVASKDLLLMTTTGVWRIVGDANGVIAPVEVTTAGPSARVGYRVELQTHDGVRPIQPLIVGDSVLYVSDPGGHVKGVAYEFSTDGYKGNDLSILSPHLFEDRDMLDWTYSRSPDSIVYLTRDDGTFMTMTYQPEFGTFGWSRNDSLYGSFEGVVAAEEDGVDAVYTAFKPTDFEEGVDTEPEEYRWIMRQTPRHFDRQRDAAMLDCGRSYGVEPHPVTPDCDWGDPVAAVTMRVSSDLPQMAIGTVVQLQATYVIDGSPSYDGPLDGEEWVVLTDDGIDPNDAGIRMYTVGQGGSPMIVSDFAREPLDMSFRTRITEVSNLLHLVGQEVSVVRDGSVDPLTTVSASGTVTLEEPGYIVHVGYAYDCDMETLPPDPNLRDKVPVNSVRIFFSRSVGGSVGVDVDTLEPIFQRTDEPYGFPIREQNDIQGFSIPARWSKGTFMYRQSEPKPVTILGHVVEYG